MFLSYTPSKRPKCETSALSEGSVSGLLEEVAGLVRRVEGLDEKLRPGLPWNPLVAWGLLVGWEDSPWRNYLYIYSTIGHRNLRGPNPFPQNANSSKETAGLLKGAMVLPVRWLGTRQMTGGVEKCCCHFFAKQHSQKDEINGVVWGYLSISGCAQM